MAMPRVPGQQLLTPRKLWLSFQDHAECTELGQSLADFGKAIKLLGSCEGDLMEKVFSEVGSKSEMLSIKLQREAIRADGQTQLSHEIALELSQRSAAAGLRPIGAVVFMQRGVLKVCLRTTDSTVNTSEIAKVCHHLSQIDHGVVNLINEEDSRITVLLDCHGISPFRFPMQMMRSFITVVQENYPNRLGVLFVIRLPPVVRVIAQTFLQIAISHGIRGDEDDIASKSAPPASIDGARYGFEPPVLQSSHQVIIEGFTGRRSEHSSSIPKLTSLVNPFWCYLTNITKVILAFCCSLCASDSARGKNLHVDGVDQKNGKVEDIRTILNIAAYSIRDWILPSRQPDRTTVYKNRALRTPFVKLGHNSTLRIEIDDHVVQDIESLIFDDTHNKW
ncbi:SEC14 cytosolic factor family protein / phosphoglyceride transfer family protein [Zea mays]|uniref:SEC14 cytosolic factor family protein / phosphoglyceride transfer family protein n=1 Tax=Zea mays TaxID=4577 RepID=A0A1D6M9L2_MAIZE|nr:SEC14 cytosolic factor family protein / phosphoglyceride transfer family protein [Zea mays]